MNDHIRRSGRFFLVIAAAIFGFGFTGAWTGAMILLVTLLGLPVLLIALLVGTVVFTSRGVRLAWTGKLPVMGRVLAGLTAPAMLALFLLLASSIMWAGSWAGTASRMLINQDRYETIIENARRGVRSPSSASAFEESGGIAYIVDPGPPVRVAFNPEGLLDNWSGIVFDPTSEVMAADGWDETGAFRAPARITQLFGGDLVRCRRLWDDFFSCSFT
ncbi:MAG TPA: hypothetical protein VGC46_07925 [Allosphingosinicella sp.]